MGQEKVMKGLKKNFRLGKIEKNTKSQEKQN